MMDKKQQEICFIGLPLEPYLAAQIFFLFENYVSTSGQKAKALLTPGGSSSSSLGMTRTCRPTLLRKTNFHGFSVDFHAHF